MKSMGLPQDRVKCQASLLEAVTLKIVLPCKLVNLLRQNGVNMVPAFLV